MADLNTRQRLDYHTKSGKTRAKHVRQIFIRAGLKQAICQPVYNECQGMDKHDPGEDTREEEDKR